MLHLLPIASLALAACAAAPSDVDTPAPALQVDPTAAEPPTHDAVLAELDRLAGAHDVATTFEYGTSAEGRALRGVELAAPDAPDDRPALLVLAALDGARAVDSTLALEHGRRLAAGYGSDAAATALLDAWRVLVVPRANPDAAAQRFATPRTDLGLTGRGVDDDRDARDGEDPPADVDGDGLVTWMRVPDPAGRWIADPHDPRATVEADSLLGQRGRWRLEREGLDTDGDERVAEDPLHDTLVDANFPAGWEEHAPDAGAFPLSTPEARALADLVIERDDLVAVLVYGRTSHLAEAPKGSEGGRSRIPAPGLTEGDAEHVGAIGERYRDAVEDPHAGDADDAGSFVRWAYEHRGLWPLAATPWTMPDAAEAPDESAEEEAAEAVVEDAVAEDEDVVEEVLEDPVLEDEVVEEGPGGPLVVDATADETEPPDDPSDAARHLAWIDSRGDAEAWRFVPWREVEHPQLGTVHVGGFAPHAFVEPPVEARARIADEHHAFLLALADAPPRVALEEVAAERLGDGLWRVLATVVNEGFLPLQSEAARRARVVLPARVLLELPDGATLAAGDVRELVPDLAGAGGRRELEWLVRAADAAGLAVSVTTTHAGSARAEVEIR